MKIKSSQMKKLELIIGSQNAKICKQALADGCKIWMFRSKKEVRVCKELNSWEEDFCFHMFDAGKTWVCIFRRPTPCMPGIVKAIVSCSPRDVRGNSIGGPGEPDINAH